MVTLSNLMTPHMMQFIWARVNTVAPWFLMGGKNLFNSGPATVSEKLAGRFMAKRVL